MNTAKTIYEDVSVTVDLDEWTDDELIWEMKDRGLSINYYGIGEAELTDEELNILIDMVINSKPGTIEQDIYEKLRKR